MPERGASHWRCRINPCCSGTLCQFWLFCILRRTLPSLWESLCRIWSTIMNADGRKLHISQISVIQINARGVRGNCQRSHIHTDRLAQLDNVRAEAIKRIGIPLNPPSPPVNLAAQVATFAPCPGRQIQPAGSGSPLAVLPRFSRRSADLYPPLSRDG